MTADEPLYTLGDLWDIAADLGMTDYEALDSQSLIKAIIEAQDEKMSGITPIDWALTRKVIDGPQVSPLETIFEALAASGDTEGVVKIRDGVYFVRHTDGWL